MKYGLLLNDMRSPNIENISIVRLADTAKELRDWYQAQLGRPWTDGQWGKSFTKGSELEWFNPVASIDVLDDYWGGIWNVPEDAQIGMGLRKGYL